MNNLPELSNLACGLILAGGLMFVVLVIWLVECCLDRRHDADEEAKRK